jgi:hypothetical protein
MAAVNRDLMRRRRRSDRHCLKYLLPDASLAPAGKAIVDRLVRTVISGTIPPSTPHLHHVHNPAQNAPIIVAFWTALICRQVRLDLRPLLVTEPEQLGVRKRCLSNDEYRLSGQIL